VASVIPFIRRVHRRVLRRHRAKGDSGIVAVGIGWPLKKGHVDTSRGLCVLYLVRQKKRRPPTKHRIPAKLAFFITRRRGEESRRTRVWYGTDVIEAKPARQTGVMMDGGQEYLTGGVLLRWQNAQGAPCWGILSVGHAVSDANVLISPPGQSPFYGRVIAQTSLQSFLDAVLIQIDSMDVVTKLRNFMPPPGAPPFVCRTLDELFDDGHRTFPTGVLRAIGSNRPFQIFGYFPSEDPSTVMINGAPNRLHLLIALGRDQTFAPGTSGGAWVAAGSALDAIQIAGYPNTYARGIGQPMIDYVQWAKSQVGSPMIIAAIL